MERHILIVDGDPSAAQVTSAGIRRVLPDASLAIEPDAERGLLNLRNRRPDVLVIDPPGHCRGVAHLIEEYKRGAPDAFVIVLASAPSPSLKRDMHRLGVDVYLPKPSPLTPVLEALRSMFVAVPLA